MERDVRVARGLLDHQLLDCDSRRCGNVDDVLLEGGPGERLVVAAVVSGPGAWRRRLPRSWRPVAWLLERLFGTGETHVPWSVVRDVAATVELSRPARELGLGRGDDIAGRWFDRLPGRRA